MKFTLSPQQTTVIDWTRHGVGNAIVVAVAGAGKTTLLVEVCKGLKGYVVFCAYNKAIADEIGEKLKLAGVGRNVRSATFHSLGLSNWRRAAPNVRVDKDKTETILRELNVPEPLRPFVRKLLSLAKQSAVTVLWNKDDRSAWESLVDHYDVEDALTELDDINPAEAVNRGIDFTVRALVRSMELDSEVIDFDDMIFAPLAHNARIWQNDWVLVDEAQDTNPARRALAKRMLKPGGRLIAVGDPHQAIYGFTGADNDSLDIIAREFNAVSLPLTTTFRCPKSVVRHSQQWVSHITAHETAPEGEVSRIDESQFRALSTEALRPGDAILCRNTKPLVDTAFFLIRRRIRCHVEGRDIGQGLKSLTNKWRSVHTIGDLQERLTDYLDKQTAKMTAKGQEDKVASLTDRIQTLFVIMETLHDDDPVSELHAVLDDLFRDSAPGSDYDVTLSTVHKAKGREWDRVYLLGRNKYMPSPFARQDWQHEQEINLMYVAVTRAKRELIEIVVPHKRN